MVAGGGVALVRVAAKLAGLTGQNEDQNVGIKLRCAQWKRRCVRSCPTPVKSRLLWQTT
ncbi:hypothetical protein IE989_08000 [Klebsiella pneumoniae]|nr:hypothetical protein [Klebsiella pneumoniae]